MSIVPEYFCLDDVRSRVTGAVEQRQSKDDDKEEELQKNTPEADEEGTHYDSEDFQDADGLQDFQQKNEEDEGLEEITIEEIFTNGKDEL